MFGRVLEGGGVNKGEGGVQYLGKPYRFSWEDLETLGKIWGLTKPPL